MPKFAANLTTMYQEFPIPDRFAAAAADGFTAVEFLKPYDFSIEEIQNWLQQSGLTLILINTPPAVVGDNTIGLSALPGREADFQQTFTQSLRYAQALGASNIHVLAGITTGYSETAVEQTLLKNLDWASDLAAAANISLMLEPLNTQDVPGYAYTSSKEVVRLIRTLDKSNIKLQYDFYHMQIMEGNLAGHVAKYFEHIGHIQFSSVPGRHEPQYGEVNLPFLFRYLDNVGYAGWVGCEYSAKASTREGLDWLTGDDSTC
jgi:hydroxypyruvate isomerase